MHRNVLWKVWSGAETAPVITDHVSQTTQSLDT